MAKEQKFWLVKTEPESFSIQHLAKQPKQTTCWSGVRNYQARNFMRDEMQLGDRVLVSGALGAVGRAAIQYLKQLGARPVAGVKSARLDEGRELAGEAVDITTAPVSPTFDFAISAAAPVAANAIAHVRDGGHVASIVPVPEGANAGNRVTIHALYHHTDAATLDAVLDAAARGVLIIPIAQTLPLEQIAAAQNAIAAGAPGKIVLQHN